MEDPLRTTSLEPFRLVLRYSHCYYCGSTEYKDTILGPHFGIRHCIEHEPWAIRDCRVYLHTNEVVLLEDCTKHPTLHRLIKSLTTNPITIVRSSGKKQSGWTLNSKNSLFLYDGPKTLHKKEGEWMLPLLHTELQLTKYVPLSCILLPENPFLTKEAVEQIQTILDNGLYLDEYEKQISMCQSSTEAHESDQIQTIDYNGISIRIPILPK
jgi:hypothetical protein